MGKRINADMTIKDAVVAMCDGNPGALTVLCDLYEKKGSDAIWLMCHLDDAGVYGSHIWLAYKDVCHENLDDLIALIPKRELLKTSILSVMY